MGVWDVKCRFMIVSRDVGNKMEFRKYSEEFLVGFVWGLVGGRNWGVGILFCYFGWEYVFKEWGRVVGGDWGVYLEIVGKGVMWKECGIFEG